MSIVNDKRPVNLNLTSIRLPVTAVASILHRVSGVFIFFGLAVLLWLLELSLASAAGFAEVQSIMTTLPARLIVWAVLTGIAYHTLAGIRHLMMDCGLGETLQGGIWGARSVFVLAVIAAVLIGVWLW